MTKEYRVVGWYGMWGEIHASAEDAQRDLDYCNETYKDRDSFHLEERDISAWREYEVEEETFDTPVPQASWAEEALNYYHDIKGGST